MKSNKLFLFPLAAMVLVSSCKKEEDEVPTPTPAGPGYTVPTTYNFANVNYSGQTTRIAMLDEISTYMSTSNTSGTVLDAQKLKDMYANVNAQFTDPALNTSGKQLKDKTFSLDQALFEAYFDTIAQQSTSLVAGTNGTAGVVVSTTDPTKKYLQGANGVEYAQLIKKGLSGAIFYYQAMETYLSNLSIDDNTTVVAGSGTNMEHHFDEAFGYFGVPIDFPTNTTGIKYWGDYCNKMNAQMNTNAAVMNACLAARAAISNSDYSTRDAQVTVFRQQWEKIIAAAIIYELNRAKANITDDAIRNHYVSEAIGFIMCLKYNSQKTISNAEITQALNYIGYNIYNISLTNIDNVRNLISTEYGLDAVKDNL
ncbi:MAG: DUF4856 domain-containing protein [Bacteroidetes bacterium]|nr:DUF4856 domain-containing protein [Bacteroidota bacterium]